MSEDRGMDVSDIGSRERGLSFPNVVNADGTINRKLEDAACNYRVTLAAIKREREWGFARPDLEAKALRQARRVRQLVRAHEDANETGRGSVPSTESSPRLTKGTE